MWWSNGNVGLWGMSYYAVRQHAVASLKPPHLKAMIAIGTDTNLVYAVTDLTVEQAGAPVIAHRVREHGGIENKAAVRSACSQRQPPDRTPRRSGSRRPHD